MGRATYTSVLYLGKASDRWSVESDDLFVGACKLTSSLCIITSGTGSAIATSIRDGVHEGRWEVSSLPS